MPDIVVRRLEPADIPTCERILRGLPDWFGLEDVNRRYIGDLAVLPAFVACVGDDLLGFLAVRHHNSYTSEIEVLAVDRKAHRRGVGRALVDAAEADLRRRGSRLLEVKTLGPSHPDEGYRKTRAFYTALGFLPLEETNLWGPDQPSLIMVKVVVWDHWV